MRRPGPTEPGIKSALMNLNGVKQVGFVDEAASIRRINTVIPNVQFTFMF
ncbi:hypothetical protein [Lactobacillus crispatus]